MIPKGAVALLPLLGELVCQLWPGSDPALFAGQIEQETCPSLESKLCWNPRAELKTTREYGFGLGQLTITERFDNYREATKTIKELGDWKWENRYDPRMQMIALVSMDRRLWVSAGDLASTPVDRVAFMLSSYNGGFGGLLSDRRLCATTPGCDKTKWFKNVEATSLKAKLAASGYGKSFYQINREYVSNILLKRMPRYF